MSRVHMGNTPKGSTRSADATKTATPSTRPRCAWRGRQRAMRSAGRVYQGKQQTQTHKHGRLLTTVNKKWKFLDKIKSLFLTI